MQVHIVQHEVFEAPGIFLDWAESRKHQVSITKLYLGDTLPKQIDNIHLLIVMGGPQSPSTTKDECYYFDANAEITLIQKMISKGKGVLGVCLGAQLLGEALGAPYSHSPEKEIGFFPIRLTQEGQADNLINGWDKLMVGHWHNDMPGLTPSCKILASSEGCPRQIIAYNKLAYGFQCHLELTPPIIKMLIENDVNAFDKKTAHPFVQTPLEITSFNLEKMNESLIQFLDCFSALIP